jgi:hypothetical protein
MKNLFKRVRIALGAVLAAAILSAGCGDSDNFVFTGNTAVAPAPAPPVASNDAFNALGNATINRAAPGVLANDTTNGGTISAFDATGSQGGTIALNADGSFNYTPVFGFVGAETFTYTLSNADGDSTATVTMTSTGFGRFVDNTAAPGGNGSQAAPFDTLAAAIAAALNGDTIFVARGDGTNTGLAGAVALPAGVDLIGEGTGLILPQTIVPAGQDPLLRGPITCGGDNTISGFTIDTNNNIGVVINGVAGVIVTDNIFSTSTSMLEYIDIDDVTGTMTIDNNTFEPMGGDEYIDIDQADTNLNVTITNNQFNDDNTVNPAEGVEVDCEGTSVMTFVFTGNTVTSPINTSTFNEGVLIDADDTSQMTITCDNNKFTNCDVGVDFGCESNATLTGTVTNNMVANPSDTGFYIEANNGTMTISGNTISDPVADGLNLNVQDNGSTFLLLNNTITNAGDDGVDFNDSEDGNVSIACRNNTVNNSNSRSFNFDWDGDGDFCVEFIGNIVSGDEVRFDGDSASGTMNVEQLNTLDTVNTLNGATVTNVGNAAINQAAGFCAIP